MSATVQTVTPAQVRVIAARFQARVLEELDRVGVTPDEGEGHRRAWDALTRSALSDAGFIIEEGP